MFGPCGLIFPFCIQPIHSFQFHDSSMNNLLAQKLVFAMGKWHGCDLYVVLLF